MRTRSDSKVRGRFSPYLMAPSGLIRLGGITQGKPWAMLSWPFGPQTTLNTYQAWVNITNAFGPEGAGETRRSTAVNLARISIIFLVIPNRIYRLRRSAPSQMFGRRSHENSACRCPIQKMSGPSGHSGYVETNLADPDSGPTTRRSDDPFPPMVVRSVSGIHSPCAASRSFTSDQI
jgi:hypothetical protein